MFWKPFLLEDQHRIMIQTHLIRLTNMEAILLVQLVLDQAVVAAEVEAAAEAVAEVVVVGTAVAVVALEVEDLVVAALVDHLQTIIMEVDPLQIITILDLGPIMVDMAVHHLEDIAADMEVAIKGVMAAIKGDMAATKEDMVVHQLGDTAADIEAAVAEHGETAIHRLVSQFLQEEDSEIHVEFMVEIEVEEAHVDVADIIKENTFNLKTRHFHCNLHTRQ